MTPATKVSCDLNLTHLSYKDSGGSAELSGSETEITTNWRAIVIAGIVTFIAAVENTVVGMSEWAYMNEIDKEADAQFFGYATAASKAFHAIAALFFAIWCYRGESFRTPLITGRLIAFAACLLYLCVEFVDTGRRYVMLICYVLFGIAASSSSILRAYVAAISASRDRPQAYSTITSATMLSIIVGPVIQALFTGFTYPGFEILPNVRFHLYSAPVWVAAATNFISVVIILVFLEELTPRVKSNSIKHSHSFFTIQGIRSRVSSVAKMRLNWPIVILCWVMKMVTTVSVVTLTTMTAIIFITNYGWSRPKTVLTMSLCMGSVGVLSILITCLYFFCRLGKFFPQRIAFLVGMVIFASMYIIAYPWDVISTSVAPYDAVNDIGCKISQFSWCSTALAPWPYLLLVVIILVMGIGIPLALVALDAIYSKCLGNINQSVMQGAMIVAEDVVLILGPIYASSVFTYFGYDTLWLLNGIIVAIGTVLWVVNLGKLEIYS